MRGAAGVNQVRDLADKKSHTLAQRALKRERIAVLLRKGEPASVIREKLKTSNHLVMEVAGELGITPPRFCDWEGT